MKLITVVAAIIEKQYSPYAHDLYRYYASVVSCPLLSQYVGLVALLLFLFGFVRLRKSKCATKSGGTLSI